MDSYFNNSSWNSQIETLHKDLLNIDLESIDIKDYTRFYLIKYLTNLKYELKLNSEILLAVVSNLEQDLSKLTLLDFGSGIGMISFLASRVGIGKVIQIDNNAEVLNDSKTLARALEIPNIQQFNSLEMLLNSKDSISIDGVISRDVIEHVYDLNSLFKLLNRLPENRIMVHNTSANMYNLWLKKYFRRIHETYENELVINERDGSKCTSYSDQRKEYLLERFDSLNSSDISELVRRTKGLTFQLMDKLNHDELLLLNPADTNTCDPKSGNWAERLLPLDEYRKLGDSVGYSLTIKSGSVNDFNGGFSSLLKKGLNWTNQRNITGPALWPCLSLIYKKDK